MSDDELQSVAMVGGTGPLGRGLAVRLAVAGITVWLGSRDGARAEAVARATSEMLPASAAAIVGTENQRAIQQASLTVIAIPYDALAAQLSALTGLDGGRVVVSTAVPMAFDKGVPTAVRPEAGSAAQLVQAICPDARVVGALHTVAAGQLLRFDDVLDEDVLVCGDDPAACDVVRALVARIPGLRPVAAGGLAVAGACEGITPLLLRLNRLHRAQTGIRITGL